MTKDSQRERTRIATNWGDNVIMANFGAKSRKRDAVQKSDTGNVGHKGAYEHDSSRANGRSVWIAEKLLSHLSASTDSKRIERGREYFRKGNVVRLTLDSHRIDGLVAGSQLEPFRVSIKLTPIAQTRRDYLIAEFSENDEALRNIVAGYQPGKIESELLFAPEQIFSLWCSCPDPVSVCKHVAAVGFAFEEHFAEDPSRILQWRNVSSPTLDRRVNQFRRDIDASLRKQHRDRNVADISRPAVEDIDIGAERFWGSTEAVPPLVRLDQNSGIDQGDSRLLNNALRTLVWSTPEMLQLRDDLERIYEELESGPRMFD